MADSTPQPAGTTIQALKLPADGSPPALVNLKTTDTTAADGSETITHEPDVTSAWGAAGFQRRSYKKLEIKNQRDESFNGTWYFLRCAEGGDEGGAASSRLQPNRHYGGAVGDVFLVRMAPLQGSGSGSVSAGGEARRAVYGDVPSNWGECEGIARALVLGMLQLG